MEVLGHVASTALRHSFKKVQRVEWQSIADDPEPFERHVRAVFSSGANVFIDIINKNICREFSLPYSEGKGLTECVKEALAAGD
jgi:hypothetical protein